jgi:excisionase family DNA binding protein
MTDGTGGQYLTPSEVAAFLHVSPKTVSPWAAQGLIPCLVTPGGHRRFRGEDVEEIRRQMAGEDQPSSGADPVGG